jgi:hypothetical protein
MLQQLHPPALDLAEHQRDARVDHLPTLRRHRRRRGDRAADVKAANHHVETFGLEPMAEVLRARELIRLHARQRHHRAGTAPEVAARKTTRIDAIDGFVERAHGGLHLAQGAGANGVFGQAVEAIQRVARQHAPPMPDHIPVIVVFRRADQEHGQTRSG